MDTFVFSFERNINIAQDKKFNLLPKNVDKGGK